MTDSDDSPDEVVSSRQQSVYHDLGSDCSRREAIKSPQRIRRSVAESWDTLDHCSVCAGAVANKGEWSRCDWCDGSDARVTPNPDADRLCEDCRGEWRRNR
jgi:DnaJ-class molecular chaperone